MIRRTVYLYVPLDLYNEIEDARGKIIPKNRMYEHLLRVALRSDWRLPIHQSAEMEKTQKQGGEGR